MLLISRQPTGLQAMVHPVQIMPNLATPSFDMNLLGHQSARIFIYCHTAHFLSPHANWPYACARILKSTKSCQRNALIELEPKWLPLQRLIPLSPGLPPAIVQGSSKRCPNLLRILRLCKGPAIVQGTHPPQPPKACPLPFPFHSSPSPRGLTYMRIMFLYNAYCRAFLFRHLFKTLQ